MINEYYNQLVEILMAQPEGMRLGNVARAIYNSHCNLFEASNEALYREIYNVVARHLYRESRKRTSPFMRTKWGWYALRQNFVVQLELPFDAWDDEDITLPPRQPQQAAPKPQAYMRDLFE